MIVIIIFKNKNKMLETNVVEAMYTNTSEDPFERERQRERGEGVCYGSKNERSKQQFVYVVSSFECIHT